MKTLLGLAALCLALSACGGGGDDEEVAPEAELLTTGQCTADGFAPSETIGGPHPRCRPCPGATGYACPLQ